MNADWDERRAGRGTRAALSQAQLANLYAHWVYFDSDCPLWPDMQVPCQAQQDRRESGAKAQQQAALVPLQEQHKDWLGYGYAVGVSLSRWPGVGCFAAWLHGCCSRLLLGTCCLHLLLQ